MRVIALVLMALATAALPAFGEIEKLATICEPGLCFHWWPKLPPLEGWQHDREQSLNYGVNALAPTGSSFASAETVMYAKAVYKPREPDTTSLEVLIQKDSEEFAKNVPGVRIEEVSPLTTADGKSLRSLTFFPTEEGGNWERVSYGEEGDFYLIFTVSSRSLSAYKASLTAYQELIGRYKENP